MKIVQSLQELERHWAVMKTYEGYPSGTTTINPAVIEGEGMRRLLRMSASYG